MARNLFASTEGFAPLEQEIDEALPSPVLPGLQGSAKCGFGKPSQLHEHRSTPIHKTSGSYMQSRGAGNVRYDPGNNTPIARQHNQHIISGSTADAGTDADAAVYAASLASASAAMRVSRHHTYAVLSQQELQHHHDAETPISPSHIPKESASRFRFFPEHHSAIPALVTGLRGSETIHAVHQADLPPLPPLSYELKSWLAKLEASCPSRPDDPDTIVNLKASSSQTAGLQTSIPINGDFGKLWEELISAAQFGRQAQLQLKGLQSELQDLREERDALLADRDKVARMDQELQRCESRRQHQVEIHQQALREKDEQLKACWAELDHLRPEKEQILERCSQLQDADSEHRRQQHSLFASLAQAQGRIKDLELQVARLRPRSPKTERASAQQSSLDEPSESVHFSFSQKPSSEQAPARRPFVDEPGGSVPSSLSRKLSMEQAPALHSSVEEQIGSAPSSFSQRPSIRVDLLSFEHQSSASQR